MSKPSSRVLALIVAAALSIAACGSSGSDEDEERAAPAANATAEPQGFDSFAERLEAEITIEGEPDYMTVGYGSVWVTRDEASAVDRIDPATNEVVATVDVGPHPCNGIVAGFGAIWVPGCEDQKLYRISPETNKIETTIDVPVYLSYKGTAPSGGIAAGHGAVWIVTKGTGDKFDALARIDPRRNEIAEKVPLGRVGGIVTVDDSSIWITAPKDDMLLRVDPVSHDVVEIDGLVQPTFLAADDEGVWVASGTWNDQSRGDGSISKVDPASNEIETQIQLDETSGSIGDVALGDGFLWVRTSFTMLAKIDPASNSVIERYKNERGNGDITVGFGSIWLSDFAFQRIWRYPL